MDEAKEKLRKENPEVASNLQKVLDTVRSGYESVGKEVDKIQSELNKKGGVRDELDNLLKNIIDRGNAAAKEFGVSKPFFPMTVRQSPRQYGDPELQSLTINCKITIHL